MNILLLVAGGWISFMNQGRNLQKALLSCGHSVELLFAGSKPSDLTHTPDLTSYRDSIVVSVGSWQDYGRLIEPALKAGCKVLPWIVSDEGISETIVKKLNDLPFFLTTSKCCQDVFVRDGIKPEKIKVLYEAIDEDVWKPQSEEQQERILNYLSIEEKDAVQPISYNLRKAKTYRTPILFTIGGDSTSKGALEVIASLHKLDPGIPWLWIIKTLPYVYSFEQSIEAYNQLDELALRVKFIIGEFAPQFMVDVMNLCDIYVAPSRGEGFGLPLAEAQMCGKMVITHDATATREIIIENQTGLLATHNVIDAKGSIRADVNSLAEQLRRALNDRDLCDHLSSQSRANAIARFGKQTISHNLLQYIDELLAIE
jgi:starch synthase